LQGLPLATLFNDGIIWLLAPSAVDWRQQMVEKWIGLSALCRTVLLVSFLAATVHAESEEEAYSRIIAERAANIAKEIGFSDDAQRVRVEKLIANQYRTLRDIHANRDAAGGSEETLTAARLATVEAHNRFLAQLRAELPCDEVEQVKDGLTYGVLNHTYNAYLAKLPELDDEEKRAIRAYLIEARELAMDGGSADEKHAIFRKYKGKINNYLSAAGYKL
jgi:hypothetical protein